MKIFIILSLLLLSVYCFVKEDIKITRRTAHAMITRHKRAYDYYERWYPRVKTPLELKKEQCENYLPCDQLSEWVGFYQAYRLYFGPI
ncbi:osteocalcin-like [Spea bombifrons]|uniref:osteocalcin-like n=1 Tax=Spea bombifrons TaxID=233779 RepID=UPI00234A419C|nr:osteocalcin-like [Spea bombifrons]